MLHLVRATNVRGNDCDSPNILSGNIVYGADTEFIDAVPKEELYNRYHIRPELMATDIIEATKESKGPNFFKKIFSK